MKVYTREKKRCSVFKFLQNIAYNKYKNIIKLINKLYCE